MAKEKIVLTKEAAKAMERMVKKYHMEVKDMCFFYANEKTVCAIVTENDYKQTFEWLEDEKRWGAYEGGGLRGNKAKTQNIMTWFMLAIKPTKKGKKIDFYSFSKRADEICEKLIKD